MDATHAGDDVHTGADQSPQTDLPDKRRRRRGQRAAQLTALIGVVGMALALAGCGGGSSKASSSSPASSGSTTSVVAQAVKYSACMRSHGVPDFPDPDSKGNFAVKVGPGLDPNSTAFQTAETDCQSLKPAGGVSQQKENQVFTQALKAAACIRQNGYPSFPNPTISNGAIGLTLGNSSIDVNSPAFEKVAKKCNAPAGLLP